MSTQLKAKLRVCASCEWIYKVDGLVEYVKYDEKGNPTPIMVIATCPKCGWSSYGAKHVFGNKCYKYAKTQEPWIEKKVCVYKMKLMDEVEETIK